MDEQLEVVSEPSLSARYMAQNRARAAAAFAGHVITKQEDRRWLIQRLYPDGKPDWTMAAEIIALEGASIFVCGDIDHVIFGYGPKDPISRLRWMGECSDLGYYVAQKARIGLGREFVDLWDEDIAHEELRNYAAENHVDVADEDALEDALEADERIAFAEHAAKALGGKHDMHCFAWGLGEVLAPRVIYAHAALARLCALLRAQEAEVRRG